MDDQQIKPGPIDGESAQQLWRNYWAAGTDDARSKARHDLVVFYLPLVKNTVNYMAPGWCGFLEVDDLRSEGIFGLYEAIDSFDESRGVPFGSFAKFRIQGAVRDHLRKIDNVKRTHRILVTRCDRAMEAHFKRYGCKATAQEIAEATGLNARDVENALAHRYDLTPMVNDTGDATDLPDTREASPETKPDRTMLRRAFLAGFDRREQLIIMLYYYSQMNMKEIGNIIGLSESSVSKMHHQIINRLRSKMSNPTFSATCKAAMQQPQEAAS